MKQNFYAWNLLDKERDIMNSEHYKKLTAHRSHCPETYIPEYTLINHCKIDAVSFVLNNASNATYFVWVDFGYFQNKDSIPQKLLDVNKLDKDKINYMLLNYIKSCHGDIVNNIINPYELIGGGFFFGSKMRMIEYQQLYHSILNKFQKIELADDDQHIALICYFTQQNLFKLHYTNGKWTSALVDFQLD